MFIDAYSGDGIPPHLATTVFFQAVRARLAAGGVVVVNVAVDHPGTERRLRRAFHAAFPSCARLVGATPGNVIFLGPSAAHALSPGDIRAALVRFDANKRLPFALATEVNGVAACE